jgi:hypothetical protein
MPWPEPRDRDAFGEIFRSKAGDEASAIGSASPVEISPEDGPLSVDHANDLPAARLWRAVRSALLTELHGEADVAASMRVSKAQAREWLIRLAAGGVVQKTKSKEYVVKSEGFFG